MVKPIPDHLHTVTPRLAVPGADSIDFYARAFVAEQIRDVFSGPVTAIMATYGERGGQVRDPFGHQWMLSKVIEEVSL